MSKITQKHPTCQTKNCKKLCRKASVYEPTGKIYYDNLCSMCRFKQTAKNKGLTEKEYRKKKLERTAKNKGITVQELRTDYNNKYLGKKEYCENKDGRLGFKCTAKIIHRTMLQVDHIDGNPSNNDPSNKQTLCANCHRYKTFTEGDHKTPGRRKLGITK